MPTLYFPEFRGQIDTAEATLKGDAYIVADGPRKGKYPKFRQNSIGKQGFFLEKEHAEMGLKKQLEAKRKRLEFDLKKVNNRLGKLDNGEG